MLSNHSVLGKRANGLQITDPPPRAIRFEGVSLVQVHVFITFIRLCSTLRPVRRPCPQTKADIFHYAGILYGYLGGFDLYPLSGSMLVSFVWYTASTKSPSPCPFLLQMYGFHPFSAGKAVSSYLADQPLVCCFLGDFIPLVVKSDRLSRWPSAP